MSLLLIIDINMSIGNPEELRNVLSDPKRHAKAFSRHTYGMLAWVYLFGAGITAQELTVSLFKQFALNGLITELAQAPGGEG